MGHAKRVLDDIRPGDLGRFRLGTISEAGPASNYDAERVGDLSPGQARAAMRQTRLTGTSGRACVISTWSSMITCQSARRSSR